MILHKGVLYRVYAGEKDTSGSNSGFCLGEPIKRRKKVLLGGREYCVVWSPKGRKTRR